jgi:hypothetical protein
MIKHMLVAAAFVVCSLAVNAPKVFAAEQKYELKSSTVTINDVLTEYLGKRVIVRMDSGENLEGTVSRVGVTLVHISKISGKDFYDAVVRIDRISAVMFKVRGN